MFDVFCCLFMISVTINLLLLNDLQRLITVTRSHKTNQLFYSDLSC